MWKSPSSEFISLARPNEHCFAQRDRSQCWTAAASSIPDDIKNSVRRLRRCVLAMRSGTRTHRDAKTVVRKLVDCRPVRMTRHVKGHCGQSVLRMALLAALY